MPRTRNSSALKLSSLARMTAARLLGKYVVNEADLCRQPPDRGCKKRAHRARQDLANYRADFGKRETKFKLRDCAERDPASRLLCGLF